MERTPTLNLKHLLWSNMLQAKHITKAAFHFGRLAPDCYSYMYYGE